MDQIKLLDWKYKNQSAWLSELGPQRPLWSEIPFFSFQCWIIGFSQKGIKKKEAFSSKANMKLDLQSQRSYSRRLFRGKQACFYLNPWARKSQLWLDFRWVTMCEHVLEKAILFSHPVTISHYLRITSWVLYNKASTEDSNHSLSNAAWLLINTAIFFKLSTRTAKQFDCTTCAGNRQWQQDCISQQKAERVH